MGVVVPMTGAEGRPPSDDLLDLISATQADFAAAAETGPLRRDPYRGILAALSGVLTILVKSVSRWEKTVTEVIAARDPLPAEERAVLVQELVAATKQGAFEGMRKEAARMVRTLDRGLAVRIGLGVGGAFVVGVLATVGTFLLLGVGPFSRDARGASAWHDIEQNNPDPRPALASATMQTERATGRRYYAGVSLWLDPLGPPPGAGVRP